MLTGSTAPFSAAFQTKGAAGPFPSDSDTAEAARSQPLLAESCQPREGDRSGGGSVEAGKEIWLLSDIVGSSQLLYSKQSRPQAASGPVQIFMTWGWPQKLESNFPPRSFHRYSCGEPGSGIPAPVPVSWGGKAMG